MTTEADARVLASLGEGGRSHHVADRLKITTRQALRALKRLEQAGKVRRADFSADNDIYWWRA